MADPKPRPQHFGPNDALVDEMYRQYLDDPASVSETWRDFFADYRPRGDGTATRPVVTPPQPAETPRMTKRRTSGVVEMGDAEAAAPDSTGAQPRLKAVRPEAAPTDVPEGARPLKGAAARIAANMDASLTVPTATSARVVPAKLLEENRRIVNDHLARRQGGKVSFTHIVGWAVLRALKTVPVMN